MGDVVCRNNTECANDECCYIKPEFEVVSKRRQAGILLPLQPIHTKHDTGVCEKYRLEHDHCYPLETANGHCGGGSGMSCQFVPASTLPALTISTSKIRRGIFMPGPGSFNCERK